MRWSLVIPVKPLALAKSRLTAFALPARADLALAMALDTVTAALSAAACGMVLVVTNDERATAALSGIGALVVSDRPDADLNAALEYGATWAGRRCPRWGVAALSADLPALRPEQVTHALAAAADWPRAVVADAAGVGTTLLAARPGEPLAPAYGDGSLTRHQASGAVALALTDVPGLQRDVDTAADLALARSLGVGRHTAAALDRLSTTGSDRA